MKQENKYINPDCFELSLEEFDTLNGKHKFSKKYKKKKRSMLKQYRKRGRTYTMSRWFRLAVAGALFIIVTPIIVKAAVNSAFFERLWGKDTKENVKSHDEVLYDEQGFPYMYTFPKREYVDVDPEKAQELIGNHVMSRQVQKKMGDTTFTVLSTVCDGNAAVVEFKLERVGGVNAFEYSQLDNEFRGAVFSQEPNFWFCYPQGAENIIVDLKRSTEDVLYCYDYIVLDPGAYDAKKGGIVMEVSEYPCTRGELFEADEERFDKYKAETKVSEFVVPFLEPVEKTTFANADGGVLNISPLAMDIDMTKGLGLSKDEVYNYENVYYVLVRYEDGTEYVVNEHELSGVHSCEEKLDNTCGMSANENGHVVLLFNRLVDTEKIASVTVNKVSYGKK